MPPQRHRGMYRLLSKLWESHHYRVLPFPGGRGAGEILEVYPGAALRTNGARELHVEARRSGASRQRDHDAPVLAAAAAVVQSL